MAKYIKITDYTGRNGTVSGYHSVNDDYELPLSTKNESYEFVDEAEARDANPALFGARSQSKN